MQNAAVTIAEGKESQAYIIHVAHCSQLQAGCFGPKGAFSLNWKYRRAFATEGARGGNVLQLKTMCHMVYAQEFFPFAILVVVMNLYTIELFTLSDYIYLLPTIIPLSDQEGDTLNLALVQYLFTCGDREIKVTPHGNAKGEPYMRTMPSVMRKLKGAVTEKKLKQALAVVANESGGTVGARSARALPRGRQQVKDLRRYAQKTDKDTDLLYTVMLMCKESEQE